MLFLTKIMYIYKYYVYVHNTYNTFICDFLFKETLDKITTFADKIIIFHAVWETYHLESSDEQ